MKHFLKNISDFYSFPPHFFNPAHSLEFNTICIQLCLSLQTHRVSYTGFHSTFLLIIINTTDTTELSSKAQRAGEEFPWVIFPSFFFFSFSFLVSMIVCVQQQKAFLKASQFLTCLESVSLGYRWPSSPDWNRLLN